MRLFELTERVYYVYILLFDVTILLYDTKIKYS